MYDSQDNKNGLAVPVEIQREEKIFMFYCALLSNLHLFEMKNLSNVKLY